MTCSQRKAFKEFLKVVERLEIKITCDCSSNLKVYSPDSVDQSSYNTVKEEELLKRGVNFVI